MRVAFGLLSMLLVLGVVAWTMRPSQHASPPRAAAAAANRPAASSVGLPAQVQHDLDAALLEGKARNDAAERASGSPADQAARTNDAGGADRAAR